MASSSSKYSSFFLLLFLSIVAIAKSDHLPTEKTTHLHFYFHELPGNGSFVVAGLHNNASTFGDIRVSDDALTEGPEMSSKVLGRAQGISVEDSLGAPSVLTVTNFMFTAGEYNGSSLAVLGMSALSPAISEHPVVGGSGKFRMARGYAFNQILTFNATYVLVQWDFYVLHY